MTDKQQRLFRLSNDTIVKLVNLKAELEAHLRRDISQSELIELMTEYIDIQKEAFKAWVKGRI